MKILDADNKEGKTWYDIRKIYPKLTDSEFEKIKTAVLLKIK